MGFSHPRPSSTILDHPQPSSTMVELSFVHTRPFDHDRSAVRPWSRTLGLWLRTQWGLFFSSNNDTLDMLLNTKTSHLPRSAPSRGSTRLASLEGLPGKVRKRTPPQKSFQKRFEKARLLCPYPIYASTCPMPQKFSPLRGANSVMHIYTHICNQNQSTP